MSTQPSATSSLETIACEGPASEVLRREFGRVHRHWWCYFLLGIFLETAGAAAIIFPALTAATSLLAVVFLGALLMVTGIATLLGSCWAGKWSGLLMHVFAGILYIVAGFLIMDSPGKTVLTLTLLIAVVFIVLGTFRTIGALVVRYPQWGWSLLNGIVTLLAGVVIYRHFPTSALWVIGLLVGLEMIFSGWTWVMLAIALRNLPKQAA
jgi:uncharacterized membrane protein HdeD (DUF308 family)